MNRDSRLPGKAIVDQDILAQQKGERNDMPSIYSCPNCGGVLWEVDDGGTPRFRCRVGHAYGALSLAVQHGPAVEGAHGDLAPWYRFRRRAWGNPNRTAIRSLSLVSPKVLGALRDVKAALKLQTPCRGSETLCAGGSALPKAVPES